MRNWWLAILVFVAAATTGSAAEFNTKARLVLSHTTAQPGQTVTAGLHLQMAPQWHTYWVNGGDSGMPTKIKWTLPEFISAQPIQWPVPEKYTNAAGDVVLTTYVYHDEVVLLIPLAIASNAPAGPVELKGSVSWLECLESCFPGKAEVAVRLTVGQSAVESGDKPLIERYRGKLPDQQDRGAKAWWAGPAQEDQRSFILEWSSTAKEVDFYPFPNTDFEVLGGTEIVPTEAGKVAVRKTIRRFGDTWPKGFAGVVVDNPESPERTGSEIKVELEEGRSGATGTTTVTPLEFKKLLPMLGFAFLGGLILNIMPCVLPVIALKVFGFVSQSQESPARVRKLGLIYGLGVLVSFLALAILVVLVQQAGKAASWGMQFQNLSFTIGMTILLFVVALNLFGLFEVTLSGSAMGAATQLAAKEGAGGAFFNGVLATLLATPCTAPFLGAALAFAFVQPAHIIVAVLLTVGLGLAFPYVLLSFQPRLMKFLPKPGAWMEKFKVAMGFPMLASAFWLFTIVTGQMKEQQAFWFGIFLVTLAFSLWVWGQFVQRGTRRKWLAVLVSIGALALVSTQTFGSDATIVWQPWSRDAVEKARAAGRPVLVDFTAKWCATCQVNKRTSIEIDRVRAKLKEINAVALRADYTGYDEKISEEIQRFNRRAIPLVVVFPKDPAREPIVLPEGYLTPNMVLNALTEAAK